MTLVKQVSWKVYRENWTRERRISAGLICNTSSVGRRQGVVLHVGLPGHRVFAVGNITRIVVITELCALPTAVNLLTTNKCTVEVTRLNP